MRRWGPAAALFAASQALYLVTLHRSVPPLDSAEFFTAIAVAGVAHPPGYPLLTLLGIVLSHLPLARPEIMINYLSALAGSVAVALTYLACLEACGEELPSLAAAAMLAVSQFFWPFAEVVEVVTLNYALVAAAFLLAQLYRRRGDRRHLWALCFVFGLGLSHLHTIVLIGPSLALLVLARSPRPAARTWLVGAAALALGLLPYLYLPFAAAKRPPLNVGDPSTVERFVAVVTRKPYGSASLARSTGPAVGRWEHMTHQVASFARLLWSDEKGVGAMLALLGAASLASADAVLLGALLLELFLGLPVFLWLANAPPTRFFEYVLMRLAAGRMIVLAMLTSVGLAVVLRGARRAGLTKPVLAAAAALPLWMGWTNFHLADRSDSRRTERMARLVMDSVEPNALVFSCYDTMSFALHAVRDVYNVKPGVLLSDWNVHETAAAELRRSLAGLPAVPADGVAFSRMVIEHEQRKRPVYFTFAGRCNGVDELGDDRRHLLPMGLVYRWTPKPTRQAYLAAARRGLDLLATQPWVLDEDAEDEWDPGVRQVLRWYADAYLNIGVILDRYGEGGAAAVCRTDADLILH